MSAALILVTLGGVIGIAWQWLHRAERNLATATLEAQRAEENLSVVEQSMIDLIWASEEGELAATNDDNFSRQLRLRLAQYTGHILSRIFGIRLRRSQCWPRLIR